jgi:hypothetical protein
MATIAMAIIDHAYRYDEIPTGDAPRISGGDLVVAYGSGA